MRSLLAVAIVFGLLGVFAWLVRRGSLRFAGAGSGRPALTVETAIALGERRSLVIVAVEGRRLLLGLAPGQVSLVTELDRGSAPDPGSVACGDPLIRAESATFSRFLARLYAPRRSLPPHRAKNARRGPRLAGALCAPPLCGKEEQPFHNWPHNGLQAAKAFPQALDERLAGR